jgi:FSR family fosmidomycin resistance protein-like MFS transporter
MKIQPLSAESRFRPTIYGVIHALVDAACVTAVVRASRGSYVADLGAFWTVAGYDLLAFGLQFPLGLLMDRLRLARLSTIVGAALAALVLAPVSLPPLATTIVAGVGNALFHLGAGGLVLRSAGGRAAPAGVFVAPGALGLGLGLWMGRTGHGSTFPIYIALAFAVIALITLDKDGLKWEPSKGSHTLRPPTGTPTPLASLGLARWSATRGAGKAGGLPPRLAPQTRLILLMLLLVSVAVRSFVGFGACFQCPGGLAVAIGLPAAAFLGKLVGGMVADRVGWLRASTGALLLSLPLIAFSGGSLVLALPGVLLFQSTMAVTLVAVYALMPRWPATAFGLPSLTLIAGAFPTFFPAGKQFFGRWPFVLLIALSAAVLALALRGLRRHELARD